MSGVVNLGTVRYTLVKNGGKVRVLTGGARGPQGDQGDPGANGSGVPVGGTTGQILKKASATDYAVTWADPIAPDTHSATNKATPVDADELPLVDSAASFGLKRLTWANLKATLKTYFDTLYGAIPTSGTFTPAISFAGGSPGIVYSTQNGSYVKVGNLVTFRLYIAMSNRGTGSGTASITGLPFASVNTPSYFNAVSVVGNGLSSISGTLQAFIRAASSVVEFNFLGTGIASNLDYTNCGNSASFYVSGHYYV